MNDLSKPFVHLRAQEAPALPIRTKYPFTQMNIGDVLLFNDSKKAESARVAAYLLLKGIGKINQGLASVRLQRVGSHSGQIGPGLRFYRLDQGVNLPPTRVGVTGAVIEITDHY